MNRIREYRREGIRREEKYGNDNEEEKEEQKREK